VVQEKSPFPSGFLGVDLFYDGAWQPIGADLDQAGVRISHGVRSEGGTADVSSLSFAVANPTGKYSPRNPSSPLSGKIGRNTPARARAALGAPWLDLTAPAARATTPSATALNIAGDIDIRWWGERDSWTAPADLISKYRTTSNQRSWIWRAEADGTLTLFWSTNGTTLLEARSLVPIPAWAGRIALRVTLDVNNGAGGRTVRFYYSDRITGTWIQLGADVVAAGTTSIFASTAPLTIGRETQSSASNTPQRVHGWEVRSGISGTVVSSRTVSALAAGAALTDAQGRAWTVTSGSVTNAHTLAVCEVAEWPMEWGLKGEESVMSQLQASGVTRRLGQGAEAVESVLYRAVSAVADGVHAYWPMEDGSDATAFGPAIGRRAMGMSAAVSPAAYDGFRGSAPLPTFGDGRARGVVDFYQSTGQIQVRWVQWTPGAGVDGPVTILRVELLGGDIGWIDLKVNEDGLVGVYGYNDQGAELSGGTYVVTETVFGKSLRFSLEINQNGPKVFWRFSKLQAFEDIGQTYGQNFTFDYTLGRAGAIVLNPDFAELGDIAIGHVTVGDTITQLFDGVEAEILIGYIGESAAARLSRLAAENGTTAMTVRARETVAMGEQQEETLLDLLAQAAAADGGILHDDSRQLGLRYRSLRSLGDQPSVDIPYTDNKVIPFEPSDDDSLTRNRVTVTRPNGTRITEEVTEGRMSTQAPPNGVGVYDTSLTLNLESDELVANTATWLVHVGTWDEGRYPTLGVDLAHPELLADPELTQQLLALTPGDRLVINNPPPWLPPQDVDVLVMGITIEATPMHVMLQWACVPARPYRVAYWNAGHRWSAPGTVLTSNITATATGIAITPPSGVTWTHVDGDYDITVGGEVMTVTNVVGNNLAVIRSVNDVVKTHPAGTAVDLAEPSFYSR